MSQLLKLKCPVCKKEFTRYVSQAKGKTVCCSKKCYAINLKSLNELKFHSSILCELN